MDPIIRQLFAFVMSLAVVCALVLATQPMWAEEPYQRLPSGYPDRAVPYPIKKRPTADEMLVDGLVLRPLMLAETLVGTAVFLVTLPFSALGGNADQAGQRLVVEPATVTFHKCLGCLPDYYFSRYDERE